MVSVSMRNKAAFFCSNFCDTIMLDIRTGNYIRDAVASYNQMARGPHEFQFIVGATFKENGVDYFNYAIAVPKPNLTMYTDSIREQLNKIHRPLGEALGESLINTFYFLVPTRVTVTDEQIGNILSKFSAWTYIQEMHNEPIYSTGNVKRTVQAAMARYFPESAQAEPIDDQP